VERLRRLRQPCWKIAAQTKLSRATAKDKAIREAARKAARDGNTSTSPSMCTRRTGLMVLSMSWNLGKVLARNRHVHLSGGKR
jgi:hypothetical protein